MSHDASLESDAIVLVHESVPVLVGDALQAQELLLPVLPHGPRHVVGRLQTVDHPDS